MSQLRAIQQKQDELISVVDSMSSHPTTLGSHSPIMTGLRPSPVPGTLSTGASVKRLHDLEDTGDSTAAALESKATATPPLRAADASPSQVGTASPTQGGGFTSRIILT